MRTPNFYARPLHSPLSLDRAAHLRRDPDWLQSKLSAPETRITVTWRSRSLVRTNADPGATLLPASAFSEIEALSDVVSLLGIVEETAYFAADISSREVPDDIAGMAKSLTGHDSDFVDLRAVGGAMEHGEGALLAYARGLSHWHARHGFCGVCGSRTVPRDAGHMRLCLNEACKAQHFPRTDPAVIMLVVHPDEDRVLLGHNARFPLKGMHSTLAGFVETGESLEDAVAREVFEEVGVRVGDVIYHSSQPWPFPSSIMLGFYAVAESTDIRIDEDEIAAADWFTRAFLENSPEDDSFRLPRHDSIARRLIRDWLSGEARLHETD